MAETTPWSYYVTNLIKYDLNEFELTNNYAYIQTTLFNSNPDKTSPLFILLLETVI